MIDSIFQDSNWLPNRYSSAVISLQLSVQLHIEPARKIIRKIQCV